MSIDTPKPRFSWRLGPDTYGSMQAAYAIEVHTQDGAVVRESKKEASDQSALVPYGGPALTSDMGYTWRVKVWLNNGKETPWSSRARFETGKLHPGDFHARWIQPTRSPLRQDVPVDVLAQIPLARTIWFDFDYTDRTDKKGQEYGLFRKDINLETLPAKAILVCGGAYATKVWINGTPVPNPGLGVEVTEMLKEGVNTCAVSGRWRKDRPGAMYLTLKVINKDQTSRVVHADASWLSRQTSSADDLRWISRDVSDAKPWSPSIEGEPALHLAAGAYVPPDKANRPRSLLWRRDFEVKMKVKSARLLISSLGWSEFRLNGTRVGDAALFPNWTDFHDRVEYAVHDVTPLVTQGKNALGAMTGNGWYSSRLMYGLSWGRVPALLAELRITYTDGSQEVVSTDEHWSWTESPIILNHIYHGEHYDARLEQPGWDRPGFEDTGWKPCMVDPWFQMRRMVAEQVAPIRQTDILEPVSIQAARNKPNAWIVDFGQNFAGRCRIRLRELTRGQTVELLHAETLQPDGSLDIANLRKAGVPDIYIGKNAAEVTWEPRFTYHGFRYVQVSGVCAEPDKDDIRGVVLHSDVERVGIFRTSNPLLNRFVENVDWGLRSNYMSVPTDCPQRTERLGWTGDAQAFQPSAQYLRDSARFFSKWNHDLVDSGGAPNQAPLPYTVKIAAPGWSDAVTVVPWNLYLFYGDTRPMRAAYSGMKRFVDHMLAEAEQMGTPYLYWKSGYGDHVSLDEQEPKAFGAYYLYRSTDLLSRTATVLGKEADARHYRDLLPKISAAINDKHMNDTTGYGENCQAEIAVPLAFGIVPEDKRAFIAGKLAELIRSKGTKPQTGFLGTPVLLPALSDNGYHNLAGELALREESPSWLHMVKAGATTVWERWNSDTSGSGMNSRNHFLFGAVTEWYFGYLAGIQPDPKVPGFKHFFIRPMPIKGLEEIEAHYETLHGTIEVSWRQTPTAVALTVVIPPNTEATLQLPSPATETSLTPVRPHAGLWQYALPSGRYALEFAKR
jgi:alpha-L-rhamnosidase